MLQYPITAHDNFKPILQLKWSEHDTITGVRKKQKHEYLMCGNSTVWNCWHRNDDNGQRNSLDQKLSW